MSDFRKYEHVERFDSPEVDGILSGRCYIFPKLDGTNASIWMDCNGDILCGSRNRELSRESDNAGFCNWMYSDGEEQQAIVDFLDENNYMRLYGEWMGEDRFVGHIKDYDEDALGLFAIFDVYDEINKRYVPFDDAYEAFAFYGLERYLIPPMKIVDNPTMADVENAASENSYMLKSANHRGEGVVVKNYSFRNIYGRYAMAKLVLEEYRQEVRKSKKVSLDPGAVEQSIVDAFLTDSEMSKAVQKVSTRFGQDFSTSAKGHVPMYLNLCFKDSILDECAAWVKKFKVKTVDFSVLRALAYDKARGYIGL